MPHMRHHGESFLATLRTWLAALLEGRDTHLAVVLSTTDCNAEVSSHKGTLLAHKLFTNLLYKLTLVATSLTILNHGISAELRRGVGKQRGRHFSQ